jgi:hypothetical protein
MIFEHTWLWVLGTSINTGLPKTRTTRLAKPEHRAAFHNKIGGWECWAKQLKPGSIATKVISKKPATATTRASRRTIYEVGKTYPVQPGRGKASLGRILLTGITYCCPGDMTLEQAQAEGFSSVKDFLDLWIDMHGILSVHEPQWSLEFKFVRGVA